MQYFELILTNNLITNSDWDKLVLSLAKHTKGLQPFSVIILFQENLIRYFISSKHDMSQLSTGLEGVIITKLSESEGDILNKPNTNNRIRFLHVPTGGTIIDLKERYKVQESLDLKLVYLDVQRIGSHVASRMTTYFTFGNVYKTSRQQLTFFPSHLLHIDFDKNTSYIHKTPPKYLSLEKTMHILKADPAGALFSVDAFPYFSQDYYLSLSSYEFDKHSFIIGASGTGKSKLIELIIDRISKTALLSQYRIVVIDPHASLADDLAYIQGSRIINFSGESTQLFPDAQSDTTAATELTTTLFKSLIAEQYNPRLERVLRFSLFVLLVSQSMSLQMLKTFLTDLDTRNQILEHTKDYIPENIYQFFGSDFNEIRTQYYNDSLLPIVSLIDEMQMQPSLVGESELSLAKTIQDNFLTVFSLNKVSMGEKVVKTVAGLLIQQIFLLAQARVFGQKVVLIIDEVSVVQNPALASILSEARKFNLTVILTQQYFGQIEKDLRDAILGNVYNFYIFKISEEDAKSLEGNLDIEIPPEILEREKNKGVKESEVRVKIMVELDPRECLLRLSANGQLLPCIRSKTIDAEQHKKVFGSINSTLGSKGHNKLPPKFEKDKNIKPLEVAESNLPIPAILGKYTLKADQAVDNDNLEEPKYFANLSEILANQSSSRKKVK